MITVMGATGNTGKKIGQALLKVGGKMHALGWSESKLAELKRAGAQVLNDGAIKPARPCENTTSTRFEDFADEWASAYQAM